MKLTKENRNIIILITVSVLVLFVTFCGSFYITKMIRERNNSVDKEVGKNGVSSDNNAIENNDSENKTDDNEENNKQEEPKEDEKGNDEKENKTEEELPTFDLKSGILTFGDDYSKYDYVYTDKKDNRGVYKVSSKTINTIQNSIYTPYINITDSKTNKTTSYQIANEAPNVYVDYSTLKLEINNIKDLEWKLFLRNGGNDLYSYTNLADSVDIEKYYKFNLGYGFYIKKITSDEMPRSTVKTIFLENSLPDGFDEDNQIYLGYESYKNINYSPSFSNTSVGKWYSPSSRYLGLKDLYGAPYVHFKNILTNEMCVYSTPNMYEISYDNPAINIKSSLNKYRYKITLNGNSVADGIVNNFSIPLKSVFDSIIDDIYNFDSAKVLLYSIDDTLYNNSVYEINLGIEDVLKYAKLYNVFYDVNGNLKNEGYVYDLGSNYIDYKYSYSSKLDNFEWYTPSSKLLNLNPFINGTVKYFFLKNDNSTKYVTLDLSRENNTNDLKTEAINFNKFCDEYSKLINVFSDTESIEYAKGLTDSLYKGEKTTIEQVRAQIASGNIWIQGKGYSSNIDAEKVYFNEKAFNVLNLEVPQNTLASEWLINTKTGKIYYTKGIKSGGQIFYSPSETKIP